MPKWRCLVPVGNHFRLFVCQGTNESIPIVQLRQGVEVGGVVPEPMAGVLDIPLVFRNRSTKLNLRYADAGSQVFPMEGLSDGGLLDLTLALNGQITFSGHPRLR